MKNLVYLSHGQGPHVDELIFSVLSAFRVLPPSRKDYRFIIVTEDAAPFEKLRVEIELTPADEMNQWLGPLNNAHRRKILALRRVLEKYDGPSMLVDGDTYFQRAPDALFDWIAPGRSVMHIDEGPLKHLQEHKYICGVVAKAPFTPPSWPEFKLTPEFRMWNAGVLGLEAADIALTDQVLKVCDDLWAWQRNAFAEQTAFTAVLAAHTRRRESASTIFHYWRPYLRNPFREALPKFMPDYANLSEAERAERCWRRRPRPALAKNLRTGLKSFVHQLGFTQVGLRSNG